MPELGGAERLTSRQVEVVYAYLEAGSEKAAAHAMGLAPATVKRHLANGRSRVGAITTAQLVFVVARADHLSVSVAQTDE